MGGLKPGELCGATAGSNEFSQKTLGQLPEKHTYVLARGRCAANLGPFSLAIPR